MLFVFRGSLVLNLDLNKVSGADRWKCSARNVETSCCFSLHDRSCQAVGMTLMASYLLVHKNPKAFFSCTFTFPVTSSPSAAAPSTFTTRCIIYVQRQQKKNGCFNTSYSARAPNLDTIAFRYCGHATVVYWVQTGLGAVTLPKRRVK